MSNYNNSNANRDSLFAGSNRDQSRGGGGNGRAWGNEARETSRTEGLDNRQLVDQQRTQMDDQDKLLDALSETIGRQKHIAIEIGKEAETQNLLLDELDVKVTSTNSKIRNATRAIIRVSKDSSAKPFWGCICFLVLVLIVLAFLAAYL
eukprot:TRINITY_DN19_c0_g1_i1.p1 TRINITY_DN19_c0_g1~~TRINITY_DN19_c0_g1_i1.p1  ORF type:complete len:149 (-),score=27.29 TRINITY_DN19_c0_g1_i1:63-509(-)